MVVASACTAARPRWTDRRRVVPPDTTAEISAPLRRSAIVSSTRRRSLSGTTSTTAETTPDASIADSEYSSMGRPAKGTKALGIAHPRRRPAPAARSNATPLTRHRVAGCVCGGTSGLDRARHVGGDLAEDHLAGGGLDGVGGHHLDRVA